MSTIDDRTGFRRALRVFLVPAIILAVFVVVLVVRSV